MANPFQQLRERRLAREDRERRRLEAGQLELKRIEQRYQRRRQAEERYDKMVTRVLGFLRGALGCYELGRWNLGYSTYDSETRTSEWTSVVSVSLVFDTHGRPAGFVCGRRGCYSKRKWVEHPLIRCGLAEAKLINALEGLCADMV
jgi:hypothetical protein